METLKQLANEDLKVLISESVLIMANSSWLTPITFTYSKGIFKGTDIRNKTMIETKRKALIRDFIINSYVTA